MAQETISFEESTSRVGGERRCWLVRAMQIASPLELPIIIALPEVGEATIGRGSKSAPLVGDAPDTLFVPTDDERMSTLHARLVQHSDAWMLIDEDSKNGSYVNEKRVSSRVLSDGDQIEVGGTVFVYRQARDSPDVAGAQDAIHADLPALRTAAPRLASCFGLLERVAASNIPVLVRGETGTGKELAARAVHTRSGRSGPFVAVNCGALPGTLVESQLFGFEMGAFSGAGRASLGLIRAADGGTLFLDEIAELSEPSQVALLRVLQEREVLPVGATRPVSVDVRVVAATHRNIETRIRGGSFREDLYSRISGAVFELVPLRERREDIGLLIAGMLPELAGDRASSVRLSRTATRALFAYDWPRNIRELRAALHFALTATDGDGVSIEHLPCAVSDKQPAHSADSVPPPEPREPTREALTEALRLEKGNISAAARRVGYSRAHFNRLLKRFDIAPDPFRS